MVPDIRAFSALGCWAPGLILGIACPSGPIGAYVRHYSRRTAPCGTPKAQRLQHPTANNHRRLLAPSLPFSNSSCALTALRTARSSIISSLPPGTVRALTSLQIRSTRSPRPPLVRPMPPMIWIASATTCWSTTPACALICAVMPASRNSDSAGDRPCSWKIKLWWTGRVVGGQHGGPLGGWFSFRMGLPRATTAVLRLPCSCLRICIG